MPNSEPSSRQRLIATAQELFTRQGITQTTTRQIAESAGVNEVTLFRQFGTKQGLLLAVFAELGVFDGVASLQPSLPQDQASDLFAYVLTCFQALADNPELVRSVVGEAGHYSVEHQQALKSGFSQATERFAAYLASNLDQDPAALRQASGVLHLLILGAAVMEVTAGLPPLSDPTDDPSDPVLPPSREWLQQCVTFWLQGYSNLPTD